MNIEVVEVCISPHSLYIVKDKIYLECERFTRLLSRLTSSSQLEHNTHTKKSELV